MVRTSRLLLISNWQYCCHVFWNNLAWNSSSHQIFFRFIIFGIDKLIIRFFVSSLCYTLPKEFKVCPMFCLVSRLMLRDPNASWIRTLILIQLISLRPYPVAKFSMTLKLYRWTEKYFMVAIESSFLTYRQAIAARNVRKLNYSCGGPLTKVSDNVMKTYWVLNLYIHSFNLFFQKVTILFERVLSN